MARIQVVYASRHGGTSGIADRIAEVLRAAGHEVMVADAARRPDADADFDGHVVGSAIYMGSWLKEALEFLERHLEVLSTRPVWLFSSGPLPGSSKSPESADPLEVALGPKEGPGSGGHRRITGIAETIGARDHKVFLGAYDPDDPPRSLPERIVRLMPGSWKVLPAGDFRDWDAIEAWARDIAGAFTAEVAVG